MMSRRYRLLGIVHALCLQMHVARRIWTPWQEEINSCAKSCALLPGLSSSRSASASQISGRSTTGGRRTRRRRTRRNLYGTLSGAGDRAGIRAGEEKSGLGIVTLGRRQCVAGVSVLSSEAPSSVMRCPGELKSWKGRAAHSRRRPAWPLLAATGQSKHCWGVTNSRCSEYPSTLRSESRGNTWGRPAAEACNVDRPGRDPQRAHPLRKYFHSRKRRRLAMPQSIHRILTSRW